MVLAKGGATGGHGSFNAGSMHSHDVGVALHHHALVPLGDVLLRQIQTKEHLGLVVQHRVLGIHVFTHLVIIKKLASTKTNDVSGNILDGPQQTTAELINRPPSPHRGQSCLLQLLGIKALAQQVLGQRVPAVRRVTALKVVDDLTVKATI